MNVVQRCITQRSSRQTHPKASAPDSMGAAGQPLDATLKQLKNIPQEFPGNVRLWVRHTKPQTQGVFLFKKAISKSQAVTSLGADVLPSVQAVGEH